MNKSTAEELPVADNVSAIRISRHPSFMSKEEWTRIVAQLSLSKREEEVACLVIASASEAQMARELSISAHTVHSHLERMYRKLGVRTRCGLVVAIFRTYVRLRD